MTCTPDQIAKLEAAYRNGDTQKAAAAAAGTSITTARRQFMRFRVSGLPRIRRAMKPRRPPPYTGPVWIGKRIPPSPTQMGAGWIGKRIKS